MSRVKELSSSEDGFTLIELMIVVAIIANLLAIAVPSYLQLKDRASQRAASSDSPRRAPERREVRRRPQRQLHGDGRQGGGVYTALKAYDAGLDVTTVKVAVGGLSYCIDKTVSIKRASATRGARGARQGQGHRGHRLLTAGSSFAAGGAADDEEGRTTPCRVSLSDVYAFVVVLALILLWGCVFALSK